LEILLFALAPFLGARKQDEKKGEAKRKGYKNRKDPPPALSFRTDNGE